MSSVSSREKNMLMVAGVLLLYAFGALIYKNKIEDWKIAKRGYQNAIKKYDEERALIQARNKWAERCENLSSLMPVFPYERNVDTYWLNTMDSVATKNNLTITRRQASKEELVGDVYELPVDCKDWEGTLESLVTFLYDLNKEGAMLDVRQIFIRPSPRAGFLKGSFTLYCAYMRGDEEVLPVTPAQKERARAEEENLQGRREQEDAPENAEVVSNRPPAAVKQKVAAGQKTEKLVVPAAAQKKTKKVTKPLTQKEPEKKAGTNSPVAAPKGAPKKSVPSKPLTSNT